jgi:hypothetical protein
MAKFTHEERENMVNFIKRTFADNVKDSELQTDEQIEKLYKEAYSYSEWGL